MARVIHNVSAEAHTLPRKKGRKLVVYEAAKKVLAGSKDGAIVLAVLGVLLCSSKAIGPLFEPFLVGRWEAIMTLDTNAGEHGNPRSISLSLYDDNAALFNGIKGRWKIVDLSRAIVLIEIPRQDRAKPLDFYELQIHRKGFSCYPAP